MSSISMYLLDIGENKVNCQYQTLRNMVLSLSIEFRLVSRNLITTNVALSIYHLRDKQTAFR